MAAALSLHARRVRRAVGLHRRLLAAGFAAAAVAAALHALSPAPPPVTTVVVAATDLPAGVPLRGEHLEVVAMPDELVPQGTVVSVAAVRGELLTSPMRAGEPLTDVRVLDKPLLDGLGGGQVAAPVRIADADAVGLLQTGDRVDVLAADPRGVAETAVVAAQAPVVVVPDPQADVGQAASGALIVLAVTPETAKRLARAAAVGPLSVSLRG